MCIRDRNASDTALKKIVQKINDYELSSGEIVSDLELSNELNISRTPVREAMQQLIDMMCIRDRHMEMRMLMSIDRSWSMDIASSLVSISFV